MSWSKIAFSFFFFFLIQLKYFGLVLLSIEQEFAANICHVVQYDATYIM